MSVLGVNPLLLGGVDGDQVLPIQRSVRLRSSASASFSRTQTTTTNALKWTYSTWVKRGSLTNSSFLMQGYVSGTNRTPILFASTDALNMYYVSGGSVIWQVVTNAVFRDPSAWYHIVVAFDSTDATSSNRLKMYVNGVQQTFSSATYPSLNQATQINASGNAQYLGTETSTPLYFDGYMTEINFIDGQALTPTSFGFFSSTTGVWQPKRYIGTYGTNGFNTKFEDNSGITATTIGKDSSGNNNNWTPNGISITAGATYDSMIDTPTPYSDGGNNRGNYPTLLVTASQGNGAYSDGNLGFKSSVASQWRGAHASMFLPSGKFYFEATIQALSANNFFMIGACGIQTTNTLYANYTGKVSNGWSVQCNGTSGGTKYSNDITVNVSNASFANWVAGDTLQCAVDVDNGRIWFGRNNVWLEGSPSAGTGASYTNLTGAIAPSVSVFSNGTDKFAVNCGQRPFAYTPPTGFIALNSFNLPDSTITNGKNHFDILTWTGDGTTGKTISGLNFKPDFVWGKARDLATGNNLVMDSVRGSSKSLISNSTSAELTDRGISTFNANGFTLDSQTATRDEINPSGKGMVAWNWKAGSSAVTNTSGSITSQVNANTSAGFSIVTYTGTGANATVGHGLGVAPKMIIVKSRSFAAMDWPVYHASLGATTSIYLNLTQAGAAGATTIWNSTAPTSSVISVGISDYVNRSGQTYVAYCFSEIAGYSRFGVYTGNGALDGPFIYLGFKARYVLLKRTDTTGYDWWIYDAVRNTYNSTFLRLTANSSVIEAGTNGIDICANGFKQTQTDVSVNASGGTYIYAAFAENPFKNSLAR
jgi:hypothetical protein